MPISVEAVIDEQGRIRIVTPLSFKTPRRAIVTILDEAVPAPAERGDEDAPQPWTARYERVRAIGRGGMSEVFLARDRQTSALVCVKELQSDVRRSALQQECRALARLKHPGILRLVNFETRGERPYLVVEYCTGTPMRSHIEAHVLAQEPLAAQLAERLFDAVAAAHEERVIHRDLKPENVLVDQSDGSLWPKVLDFGVAIVEGFDDRSSFTGIHNPMGTLLYMAPEQIVGDAVTGACDVYALGEMCAEMLMGARVFSGTRGQILRDKSARDGLTIEAPRLRVGRAFADLVHACTRVHPGERPSASDARDAMRAVVPVLGPQSNIVPANLALAGVPDARPARWFDGFGYVDRASTSYECRIVRDESRALCTRLAREDAHAEEFGVLMQRVPAAHLAGATVRFEAWVRSDALKWAGLWLRADAASGQAAFDNMHDRPIAGTRPWTPYAIELTLPASTEWLNFGFLLSGGGAILVRDARLTARMGEGAPLALGLPGDSGSTTISSTDDAMMT